MLDQSAEIAENRKLDELLYILTNPNCDNGSDVEASDLSDVDSDEDNNQLEANACPKQQLHAFDGKHANLSYLMPKMSYEEFDIITDCDDADLKQLLIINRTKHVELKSLQKFYINLLNDIESTLCHYSNESTTKNSLMRTNRYISKLGYPYFNANRSAPPSNADYFDKKAKGELNLCYVRHRLKSHILCADKIRTSVIYNFFSNKLLFYEQKISEAGQLKVCERGETMLAEYRRIRNDMRAKLGDVGAMFADCPDLYDDTFLDWQAIAESDYADHTLGQYLRAVWNYYVHPAINKSVFTPEEDKAIIEFVGTKKHPNWSSLADTMQTNRSAHQICVYYASKLKPRAVPENMSDVRLFDSNTMRIQWSALNHKYSKRGITRFYHRYKYVQAMKNRKMGSFSIEEDIKIIELMKQFGKDYQQLSKLMPDRSSSQIKHRYLNNLESDNMNYGNWHIDEDKQIVAHVQEHGSVKWPVLANAMSRNASQLRHRYKVIKRHLDDGKNFTSLPRRRHVTTFYGLIQQRKQLLHSQCKIDLTDIDEQLKQYFLPSTKLQRMRCMKRFTGNQLETCVISVRRLLKLLQANLELPENFEEHNELDHIDVEILKSLCGERRQFKCSDVVDDGAAQTICPPNLSTVQGLRYLLLNSYKVGDDTMAELSPGKDVELLTQRFQLMFMWPSLMSTVSPPEDVLAVQASPLATATPSSAVVRRPVGRPRKNMVKIHKMAEANRLRLKQKEEVRS